MRFEQDPGLNRNEPTLPKEATSRRERLTVLDQHPGAQRLLYNIRSEREGENNFVTTSVPLDSS